jgi:hypothetical protein
MTIDPRNPEGLRIYPADITPRHRDGYIARVDCLIYGYPGQIEITVDTHDRQYSSGDAQVFNPVDMRWDTVYSLPMSHPMLIDLPVLPERPEALPALNALALTLWAKAQWVMSTSHARQDAVDGATEVAKLEAKDAYITARIATERAESEAAREAARLAAETDARRLNADVSVEVNGEDLPVDVLYAAEEKTA